MTPREVWFRLTVPFTRARLARELRAEIDFHLELRAEAMRAHGTEDDPALAARKQFGNASRIESAARDVWGWQWLDGFGQDVRHMLRQLARSPGFVLVATLTIAVGVAINAAAFTFYDTIVLKPLPVAEPSNIVRVVQDARIPAPDELPFTAFEVLRRDARAIRSVVATTGPQTLTAVLPGRSRDDARLVNARFVSPDFAQSLGIGTTSGRWFGGDDADVAVLDHDFWIRVLGGSASVVGQRIVLRDHAVTVVGIAPEGFAGTGLPAAAPDIWLPMSSLQPITHADWRYDGRAHWQVLGRLAPDATLGRFSGELDGLRRAIPDSAGQPLALVAKHATFFQADSGELEVFKQASAVFMVALTLILGIGVVNLVNLFAARNAAREREIVVRLTLGASRARVARQLATESFLIAAIGGALGLMASRWAAAWFKAWLAGTMASISGGSATLFLDLGIDWRVAAYTAVLSAAIGLAVGLWPALTAARADVNGILRQGGAATASGSAWAKRNVLLGVQVTGCIVLLASAGFLLGGLRAAPRVDPGFDAAHLLVVDFTDGSLDPVQRATIRSDVERRLGALPMVRAVAWTRRVPFAGTHLRRARTSQGEVTLSIDDVSASYFDAMGMTITRGRTFTAAEIESKAPVMLISEAMARLRWPGADPVGRSVPRGDVLSGPDTTSAYTIIGVVRDIRSNFLSRVNGPSAFYPNDIRGDFGAFLVRTRGEPSAAMNTVRLAVASSSPVAAAVTHVMTMEDGPMALQRLMAQAPAAIALALAVCGLVLATIGLYGVIAQIVARRTREIGLHIALGARSPQVVGLVMRKTLRPVAWGACCGGLGAVGVSLLLRSVIAQSDAPDLTFGAGAFNPLVFAGVVATLASVVVAAAYVPTRRATAVDPTVALRVE